MVEYEGTWVGEELLDHVDVKETRADWVLAVFGKPDARAELGDGSEIWRWTYRPKGAQPMPTLLGGRERPVPGPVTSFVRVKDGVVVEKGRG